MLFLAYYPKLKLRLVYFLVVLTLIFSFGCFRNYFKVNRMEEESFRGMVTVGEIQKDYIIHFADGVWLLGKISIEDTDLRGFLMEVDAPRSRENIKTDGPYRYKSNEKYVLQEVHLYTKGDISTNYMDETGLLSLPLSQINEIKVYDRAVGATIASYTIGVIGLALATAIIITAVSSSSTSPSPPPTNTGTTEGSSCPYVYAYNGQTFRLIGETFGGAILPQLERHDFMPLPGIQPVENEYRIRLSNELRERQRINLARLVVIDHPEGSQVLMDQKGKSYTILDPQSPRKALTGSNEDVTAILSRPDDDYHFFYQGNANHNEVILNFSRPPKVDSGKLILRGNATYWADLIYGQFTRQFGIYYNQWFEQLKKESPDKLETWMRDQLITLTVHMETPDGWRQIEEVLPVGPLAPRDFVVPVDLSDHPGNEILLKLSTGPLFWQVDYAAMDFTAERPVYSTELSPSLAIGSDGIDYTQILSADDQTYVRQEQTGHQVEVRYPALPPVPGRQQTFFLHSKGFYEHIRSYDGFPDVIELYKFRQKEYFVDFSQERFRWFLEANSLDETLLRGKQAVQ